MSGRDRDGIDRAASPGGPGRPLFAAALAAAVFLALGLTVALDPPGAFDRDGIDVARHLSGGVGVARVITVLGTSVVAGTLVLAAVLFLALAARRRRAAIGLAVAGALTLAADHLAKPLFDRARPPHPASHAGGSAYPSGHATHSILLLALAVALAPHTPRPRLTVAAGATAAVLVGLSRVELRVHWPTDVIGGWALGTAVCLLVVAAVVHNGRRP